jgi:hypothetical protein
VAGGEQAYPALPVGAAGGRIIASPFQFTTNGDDNLRIVSQNSATGVTIAIQGRRLDDKGLIIPFAHVHTPNTDRSAKTQDYLFGAGALLNLTVFVSAGTPLVGQTFVKLQLIRGITGATVVLGTLLQGYVTPQLHLGWPGSPIVQSTDGPGCLRTILGSDPAAGQEISELVPTGARWELKAIGAGFTTDGTVAARRPGLVFNDGVANYGRIPSSLNQDASEFFGHTWTQGVALPIFAGVGYGYGPLPTGKYLLAAWRIKTITENLQAGDNWDNPRYLVEEWLEL